MRDSIRWLELVGVVLRPSRTDLEHFVRAREDHLASRRLAAEQRARALAACERRIEGAREAVFSANDGVVSSLMTDLEREWRMISRLDPEGGLMDLWAAIAPASWIDRKRWRDAAAAERLDAAIAFVADVDGVEAAEAAALQLRKALAAWAFPVGARLRWTSFVRDARALDSIFDEPLERARQEVARTDSASVVFERAEAVERAVEAAMLERFADRRALARDIGCAAHLDYVWRAASLVDRPSPVAPLVALWKTGYGIAAIDASGITLELPPL